MTGLEQLESLMTELEQRYASELKTQYQNAQTAYQRAADELKNSERNLVSAQGKLEGFYSFISYRQQLPTEQINTDSSDTPNP